MPLTKSAKKALQTDKRRKAENDLSRAKIKSALKGAKIAIRNSQEDAAELVSKAYSELDTAAKKNVIHKNKAARLKSRLVKKLKNSGTEVAPKKATKTAAKKAPAKKTSTSKKK